ncbi:MAG: N-acetylmuramoyl-L-alanine amidase, partial [Rhodothermales bacterium]|nr:N-acetylmuramoyl-L-alanine amidase [Rhodothermales bacterium]
SEANFLNSSSGQTYMASAIYRAIRDFKVSYERELNLVSSTQ